MGGDYAANGDNASVVLAQFVIDGRINTIPRRPADRRVVLEWLVEFFDADTTYSEKMVNLIIGQRHADTAALRRYMVDDGLMDRSDGQYWRCAPEIGPMASAR